MTQSTLRDRILLLAVEGYSGLWEVYGETIGLYGDLPESEVIDLAAPVLHELAKEGLVQLYWTQEPLLRVWPVEPQRVAEALAGPAYWEEPIKDAISIRILATRDGEAAFARQK